MNGSNAWRSQHHLETSTLTSGDLTRTTAPDGCRHGVHYLVRFPESLDPEAVHNDLNADNVPHYRLIPLFRE